MMDELLNDRLTAISGKLDRVLTRQQEQEVRDHDILARLARIEASLNIGSTDEPVS